MGRRRLFFLAWFCLLAALSRCSFGPLRPQTVTVFPPAGFRDGPAIAGMSHYALMIQGGNQANSLRSSDVGNRSLSCLGFEGAVNFPFSYAQATSGISVSLPAGTYTFTFFGFANSLVVSPSTLARVFAASPSLTAYKLAQVTGTVSGGEKLNVTSSYVAVGALDKIAACPPLTQRMHASVNLAGTQIKYLWGTQQGDWDETTLNDGSGLFTDLHLAVDNSGYAHLIYVGPYATAAMHYATNRTGSFTYADAIPTATTNNQNQGDIAVGEQDSDIKILHNRFSVGNYLGSVSHQNGASWVDEGNGFATSVNFFDFRLAITPGGKLLSAATEFTSAGILHLAIRDAGAVWQPEVPLNTAGSQDCLQETGEAAVAFDSSAKPHVIYRCRAGDMSYHFGYASQPSGTWITQHVASVPPARPLSTSLAATPTGDDLYMAYGQDGGVFVAHGHATSGLWESPVQIDSTGFLGVQGTGIIAVSTNDVRVIAMHTDPGTSALRLYQYDGASWSNYLIGTYGANAELGKGFYLK